MTRDLSNRLREVVDALQWDRGRWAGLLLILAALDVVLALGDSVDAMLRYDRGALESGGWWRLITAHAVHLDLHHLLLNELGLVLIWALFADAFTLIGWLAIVAYSAVAISAGLWWLSPRVGWYVGASGLLHAAMGAGVAKHLAVRAWDRWILLGCLCAKIAYEQFGGHEPPLVVVDAHLYGAVSGFIVGAALCARIAIIRHRRRV